MNVEQRIHILHAEVAELKNKDKISTTKISLLTADVDRINLITPPLPNQIDGGAFEYSKDRQLNATLVGGDADKECFNWYRQTQATTTLAESSANALKTSGHSLYAASEGANGDIPQWNTSEGCAELGAVGGTSYDIAAPFSITIAKPSVPVYVQFVAKRRTSTAWPSGAQIYAGIWDNTSGQEGFIEGGAFTLNATKTGTHSGGTTLYQYKVIATTDWGDQYESTVPSVTNCLSTLDGNNYISLSWEPIVGTVDYSIYEWRGAGNVFLVYQIQNGNADYYRNGTTSLRDTGIGTFPTVSAAAPVAYTETDANGAKPFNPSDTEWTRYELKIGVPISIAAVNTDKHWLRIGLTGATTDARQALIQRVGVCLQSGAGWSRSATDLQAAHPYPSTTSTTGTVGTVGTGGGYEGDPRCITEEMTVRIIEDGKVSGMPAGMVRPGDVVLTRSGKERKIRKVSFGEETDIYRIETENGIVLRASATEPVMRSMADKKGKRIVFIEEGELVLTYYKGEFDQSRVVKAGLDGHERVVMITLEGEDPTYIAGSHADPTTMAGVVIHNRKLTENAVF